MRPAKFLTYICLVSLLITLKPVKGYAMSLLYHPEQEIVVASPMEGQITYKGKPAADAKVERILKWKDDKGQTDFTNTNKDGFFKLPIVKESAKLPKLAQFVAHQEIAVTYEGTRYVIWVMGKMGKTLFSELGGNPKNLRCELMDDLNRVETDDGLLGTVCNWDEIEKQGE